MNRIDVHAHLIPAVDDGCQNMDESLACARALLAAGYTEACCTPHIWPNLPHNIPRNIARWTSDLQRRYEEAGVPLKLHPGGELNLAPRYLEWSAADVPTYGMLGRHCLFDLWTDRIPDFFEPVIRHLQGLGLVCIIAHPERMRAVQEKLELADWFTEIGLLLQGNLQCFADAPHASTRITAERFLMEGRYFMLGSDTHRPDSLPCRIEGLRRASELAGPELIHNLMVENPRKLLNGQA